LLKEREEREELWLRSDVLRLGVNELPLREEDPKEREELPKERVVRALPDAPHEPRVPKPLRPASPKVEAERPEMPERAFEAVAGPLPLRPP